MDVTPMQIKHYLSLPSPVAHPAKEVLPIFTPRLSGEFGMKLATNQPTNQPTNLPT
jgi:hypothetical protein